MLTTPCPSSEDLRHYALGECDEPEGRRIEEHLNRCPACEETLAEFDSADDTLVRHLPLVASADAEEGPGWLDRLRRLPQTPNADEEAPPAGDGDQPSDFLGSYRLLGCIGRGGMGIVYRAMHNQLDRVAALKVLSPHLVASAAARARFDREIQIVGRLEHSGIVRASDAGREGRVAYLVMEYIDGIDLARLVRRGGPLNAPEACEAARQMAEALAAAHAIGAVHRDVKPSNVMLDRAGRAKLLDFGLAHLSAEAATDRETTLGRLLGTLDYLAPEQAEGEPLDHRADVYGLGATLFFLLTGRPPHGYSDDRPLLAQLRRIAEHDPPPPASLRPDLPAELNELVARLLARRPEDRPASAAEVAARLAEFAGGDLAARVAETAPPPGDIRSSSPEEIAAAAASLADLLGERPAPASSFHRDPAGSAGDEAPPHRGSPHRRGSSRCRGWLGVVLILQTSQGTSALNRKRTTCAWSCWPRGRRRNRSRSTRAKTRPRSAPAATACAWPAATTPCKSPPTNSPSAAAKKWWPASATRNPRLSSRPNRSKTSRSTRGSHAPFGKTVSKGSGPKKPSSKQPRRYLRWPTRNPWRSKSPRG
jgi:serine/threonine protein kinase